MTGHALRVTTQEVTRKDEFFKLCLAYYTMIKAHFSYFVIEKSISKISTFGKRN